MAQWGSGPIVGFLAHAQEKAVVIGAFVNPEVHVDPNSCKKNHPYTPCLPLNRKIEFVHKHMHGPLGPVGLLSGHRTG